MSVNVGDLATTDPEVLAAIRDELGCQRASLELIASESLAPVAVMQTQGSVLANKYAEGHPGRRYYRGCEHVDVAEQLAVERVKALFGADHANAATLTEGQDPSTLREAGGRVAVLVHPFPCTQVCEGGSVNTTLDRKRPLRLEARNAENRIERMPEWIEALARGNPAWR